MSARRGASRSTPRVAVIYHFYPHYRRAVVEALAGSEVADFTFIGDVREFLGSVEPAKFSDRVQFIRAPTHHLFGPFMWQWGAIRWAVSRRFDTIIMHSVPHWPCTWLGAFLARALGKRVFFWGHGFLRRPHGLKGLIRRIFHRLPHGHLFYGWISKAYAIELGWAPERLHVIANSLDSDRLGTERLRWTDVEGRRVREEIFGDPDVPVIGCSSRLIPMRRLPELLRAVSILARRGIRANVLLIGDGPERERIRALSEELGVRVHFEGACYDETRIARLIMSCSVTVSPGKTGLTAIHSLGYGVPVVSHEDPDDQAPEWEAIIPGRTGSLFRREDVESLAAAIEPWIASAAVAPHVRDACVAIVERVWNPRFQVRAIERAVRGLPADDLANLGIRA